MSITTSPPVRRTPPGSGLNLSFTSPIELEIDSSGHLDISNKAVSSLSEKQLKSIGNAVRSMNASENQFATLDFLKFLPKIVSLNASGNRLRRLFSIVHVKSTLEVIDLSHNAIGTVEYFLTQMVNLRILNLSFNQLMAFPLINELVELTELNLSSNHIVLLPDVKRLPNLKTLKLSLNGITTIKDASTRLPSTLISLELCDNHIADLSEIGFLKSLPDLKQFSFSGNPATVGEFNYRPYAASRLISLTTVDGNDLSDEELLLGQRFHLGNTVASFYPGCCRQNELVQILMKESPTCSNPFSVLTPTNPRLLNVIYDFIHNKSDLDSSSMSESILTPKRVTRSVPDIRGHNIRVISPPRGNRNSGLLMAPVVPRQGLKLPDLLSPDSHTCHTTDSDEDQDSVRSSDTVVLTESISLQLDLLAPTVEPLPMPSATPTPEPRSDTLADFSPDLSVVAEVTEPESGFDASQQSIQQQKVVPQRTEETIMSIAPTPSKNVLELINEDESILQQMPERIGWTNIVRESPLPSLISDERDSKVSNVITTTASDTTPKAAVTREATTTVDQVLKKTAAAVTDIRQQLPETPNIEVLKRLDSIEIMLKDLSKRVDVITTHILHLV